MPTQELIRQLQQLQQRLCEMASDLGSLTDPEIVAVSEEADRLIVQLQRERMEEALSRAPASLLPVAQPPEEPGEQSGAFFLKHS